MDNNNPDIKTDKIRKSKAQIKTFVIKLIGLILILYISFAFVFGIFVMKGESMYPQIKDGDFLLYFRLDKSFVNNEVVVFERNKSINVSRVIGREGDVISLSEDGYLLVNGNLQNEKIFFETKELPGGIEYPYTVPKGSYFVLSDYRIRSSDSRMYGAISKEQIKGKLSTFIRLRNF